MAGLASAWRLSEPGWRDRYESITVYQRGWRLGGKGASSRGPHARIEEHGLHIWLGSYENAFAMLRECYRELDRPTTDPDCPIARWDQAMIPADNLGLTDHSSAGWLTWLGSFTRNQDSPGDPEADGREMTVVEFLSRAMQLVIDFTDSQRAATPGALQLSTSPQPGAAPSSPVLATVRRAVAAALLTVADPRAAGAGPAGALECAALAVRDALDVEQRPDHKRSWQLLSLMLAVIRGILADNLITHPNGFRAINDEDFSAWILRHGAHPDVLDFALVRGLYDLVFGYENGDPERPAFGAGLAVFLTGLVLFCYRGAIFWKMTAGMGDVIIAPVYQALRNRGVDFEFFHRVTALHLDERHQAVGAITLGRQLHLADGRDRYDPLVKVHGLPVFPGSPIAGQIVAPSGLDSTDWHALENHWADHRDVETRTLVQGADFDDVVLAVSLGMIDIVASELVADKPEWRAMTTHVKTVATQAFQLWLRPDEAALGWAEPGVTVSAYLPPFETWASMPQTLWAEDWPEDDRPATVAYFCGAFGAAPKPTESGPEYLRRQRARVHASALRHIDTNLGLFFPHALGDGGFDWRLLSGAGGRRGAAALDTQWISVNVDPSDRYVQSVPGSERHRLRPDESGYDNLVLAGDWTDSGINAGCIEAAVMSGLQAGNALLGRGRYYRVRGFYLP